MHNTAALPIGSGTVQAYRAAELDLSEFGSIYCDRFDVVEIMLQTLPVIVHHNMARGNWTITLAKVTS